MIAQSKQELIHNKLENKIWNAKKQNQVMCPNGCDHYVNFTNSNKNKILCPYCGNYVFKTKRDEFEYRLNEAMKRPLKKEQIGNTYTIKEQN